MTEAGRFAEQRACTHALDFDDVYRDWVREVMRWVRAFGGLDADLEDLTQEVFVVVRRKLATFDGANLAGWLYRIAQRTVADYRRRAWFRRALFRPPQEPDPVQESASGPEADLEHKERCRLLVEILDQLSAKRRTAFVLFEIEGYSGEEIAALEGIPVNTVWTRLHHARKDFYAEVVRRQADGRLA